MPTSPPRPQAHPAQLVPQTTAAIGGAIALTLIWPAAAAVSLSVAVGGSDVTFPGLLLVATGTMSAYGLDRWIDSRDRDPLPLRRALAVCVLLAATVTAILACTAWWRFEVCAALGLIAGAYVPLKRFVPKNVLTTVAWTTAIATLPFAQRPPLDAVFGASVLSVALIMAANTVLCDIPDFAADRQAGVRGITPRFGPRAGAAAAVAFGGLGTVVAGDAGRWGLAVTAFGLALLAILLVRNPGRRVFRLLADALVTVIPGPVAWFFR